MLKIWARAVGFYRGFLLVSLMPVSLGVALYWQQTGALHWPTALLTMVAVWFFHAGTNLLNDYYDHLSGTDDINQVRTPFSGGTRVIQENLLPAEHVRLGGIVAYAIGAVLFLLLFFVAGYAVLALAVFGMASGLAYNARPVWLAYRGWGELVLGLTFGPALVAVGQAAQSGRIDPVALWLGGIVGLWAAAIITVNEVPDYVADKTVGKRNLVVRFGLQKGLMLWAGMLYAALGLLAAGVFLGVFPPQLVLGLLVLPLVGRLTGIARRGMDSLDDVIAVCGGTIKGEIILWTLLLVGLVAARLMGGTQ